MRSLCSARLWLPRHHSTPGFLENTIPDHRSWSLGQLSNTIALGEYDRVYQWCLLGQEIVDSFLFFSGRVFGCRPCHTAPGGRWSFGQDFRCGNRWTGEAANPCWGGPAFIWNDRGASQILIERQKLQEPIPDDQILKDHWQWCDVMLKHGGWRQGYGWL